MKKTIVLIMFVLGIVLCFAQTDITPAIENVVSQITSDAQELDIQIKALMPDITVVKIKADTYAQPGRYNYSINLGAIQEESKSQLTNWKQEITKWLEESK